DLLPEAVDRHPRRQGMAPINQPARQAESVARQPLGQRRQKRWRVATDLLALLIVLAALQDVRRLRLLRLLEDQRRRGRSFDFLPLSPQDGDLPGQLHRLLVVVVEVELPQRVVLLWGALLRR